MALMVHLPRGVRSELAHLLDVTYFHPAINMPINYLQRECGNIFFSLKGAGGGDCHTITAGPPPPG